MPASSHAEVSDNPAAWLGETRHINTLHPRIRDTSAAVTARLRTPRDKALAIFRHVRDNIRFGFAAGFWDNRASDVLAGGVGYCNTKSTAFVALLRSAGVPSRQVFVDIHASVLDGILDPGTPYVDHSCVEVFLDDRWIATDAYIADPALFRVAQDKAAREDRVMGYGVHATGSNDWDGRTPAFSQYNILDPRPIGTQRWGVFADVGAFYRGADGTWNRLNPVVRGAMGALAAGANRRADTLRHAGV